ncbi:MAG: DUF624 domain-containing protein [Oscillospiraceae bacterium]|nr:DUF624 domain-containing protein [Oscillospiraceae bacterium]
MKEKQNGFEKLGNLITIAANAVLMNLMFLVACIPVVTIGAAWNGLFSAIRYNIRGEKWFEGFKVGFKTRFWRSLLAWVILMIPILFFIEFDVISAIMVEGGGFVDFASLSMDAIVRLIFACLITLMLAGFCGILMLLNVYIPTSVGTWLSNGSKILFQVPLQAAATGLLMWAPLVILQMWPDLFIYIVMVFVVVYFLLSGLGITVMMKNALIDCLVEARAEGTLLTDDTEDIEETDEDGDTQEEKDI